MRTSVIAQLLIYYKYFNNNLETYISLAISIFNIANLFMQTVNTLFVRLFPKCTGTQRFIGRIKFFMCGTGEIIYIQKIRKQKQYREK